MAMGPGKRSTGLDFWSIESLFALANGLLYISNLDGPLEIVRFMDEQDEYLMVMLATIVR
jgi:hypothetical protein